MTESNDKTPGPVDLSKVSPNAMADSPLVFVSYASQDAKVADEVVKVLEDQGHRCWIAPRDVPAGALYADAIIDAINHSVVFVLVLSERAVASRHVGKEIERASSKRKPFVVLRIDKTALTRAFEYFLSESQWVDAGIGGIGAALPKVVDGVKNFAATNRQDHSRTQVVGSISSKSHKLRPWLLMAVGGLAVLGFGWLVISKSLPRSPLSPTAAQRVSPIEPAAADASVAVLPFADLSEKKDQEFFSDGLSEEIINTLSSVQGLKVSPRSSSFFFKDKPMPIAEIARQLGVAHVLEGSVRRSGDKLRITAQLVQAVSGRSLWSQSFDRKADDILKIQDDIARAVASALKGRLKASLLPGSTGTENAEAYSLYFQAKQTYLLAQSEDDLRHALAQTNKVVDLDPRFAEVFALRSMLYDDLEMQTKAREAIAKALELAPNLGSAHFVLGRLLIGEYDLLGAEKEFHRALELDPGRWSATGSIAMIEAFRGQFTQSIEGQQTSIASDPVNWELYAQLALVYLYAGRFPESLTAYQRARELRPNGLDQHAWASAVLLAQGKAAEALAELDLVADEDIRLGCGCRTIILDALGRTSEANAALARLIEAHAQNEAYGIAAVYASRGDADRAFEWLDRAHAQREFALHWVKVDPVFKRIRNDRRFHALLLKLHLV